MFHNHIAQLTILLFYILVLILKFIIIIIIIIIIINNLCNRVLFFYRYPQPNGTGFFFHNWCLIQTLSVFLLVILSSIPFLHYGFGFSRLFFQGYPIKTAFLKFLSSLLMMYPNHPSVSGIIHFVFIYLLSDYSFYFILFVFHPASTFVLNVSSNPFV